MMLHALRCGARLLLGTPFVIFGLNTFLWAAFDKAFMQPPADLPKAAAAFLQALTDARFMHPLRGAAEFAGGLMVLTGVMTPLGLVILAPVLVHIVLYHLLPGSAWPGDCVRFARA